MPHYRFNVYNGIGFTRDDEGTDVADQAAAHRLALESIRSIVSAEAKDGMIDLAGRIEIVDDDDNVLLKVTFNEAFEVTLPPGN